MALSTTAKCDYSIKISPYALRCHTVFVAPRHDGGVCYNFLMSFRRGFTLIELLVVIPLVPRRKPARRGFTLIELLVVIAIVAVLAVVVVLVLNPAQLLQQARDSNRLSDLATINSALSYLKTDQPSASLGSASTSYISVLDQSATSTAGDQCQGLGLLSLGSSSWHCAASSTYRASDGTGWIPAALSSVSYGTPLAQLPTDPTNVTSSGLYYSYATDGTNYEVASIMESSKYRTQFGAQPQLPGYPQVAALGSSLSLSPLWNPSGLVGYWPLDEGSGTAAIDYSGNNTMGTWNGTQIGTAGYYSAGKVGTYSASLNGTNDYANLGNPTILNLGSVGTVSAWVYRTRSGAYQTIMSKGKFDAGTNGYTLGIRNTNALEVLIGDGGSYNDIITPYTVPASAWTHVAMTWSSSTLTAYANGSSVASMAQTRIPTPSSSIATIGYNINESDDLFGGQIDDVRVYNRALSAAEIFALYNAEK